MSTHSPIPWKASLPSSSSIALRFIGPSRSAARSVSASRSSDARFVARCHQPRRASRIATASGQ